MKIAHHIDALEARTIRGRNLLATVHSIALPLSAVGLATVFLIPDSYWYAAIVFAITGTAGTFTSMIRFDRDAGNRVRSLLTGTETFIAFLTAFIMWPTVFVMY